MKTKFKTGDRVKVKRFRRRPSNWNSDGLMDHLMGKIVEIKKHYSYISKISYEIYDELHDRTWLVYETQVEPVDETIVIYRKDNKVIAFDKLTGKKGIARCNPEDTFNFETGAKLAFERLFATPLFEPKVKEVKRCAKVGEYVKIINAKIVPVNDDGTPAYKNGDIIKIIEVCYYARFKKGGDKDGTQYVLYPCEYAVLEGYEPPKTDETLTYYNGKIIFTKGDDVFKTGHIYEIKDGKIERPYDKEKLPYNEGPLKNIDDVKDYFTGYHKRQCEYGWSSATLELIEVQDD